MSTPPPIDRAIPPAPVARLHESDDAAIRELLAEYREAVRNGDFDVMSAKFHPDAVVCYPDHESETLASSTAQQFATEVAEMVASGMAVVETALATHVDGAGAVALARVDFHLQLGEEYFRGTDFFTLARLAGRWQIVQKLYDMNPAPGPPEEAG
jgi:ketosteroid isomerase-like protein